MSAGKNEKQSHKKRSNLDSVLKVIIYYHLEKMTPSYEIKGIRNSNT